MINGPHHVFIEQNDACIRKMLVLVQMTIC